MKKLILFTFCVVLSLNLWARENPFEATNAYEEEHARIVESNETSIKESMQEEQYIQEMQKKMQATEEINKVEEAVNKIVPMLEEKPKEKIYTKEEVDSLIQKTKKQTEYKTKQIVKKELEKSKAVEPTQIVYVKPRLDVVEEELVTKELLPFIKIQYNDDKLIIVTDHDISKKFTLDRENKIIVDYKAKLNFYTKRDFLNTKNFKKIAVGNHKKEKYFRVVIELNSKPSNFDVSYKDKLITISRTN